MSLLAQRKSAFIAERDEYILVMENGRSATQINQILTQSKGKTIDFSLDRQIVPKHEYYLISSPDFHDPDFIKNWFLSFPAVKAVIPNLQAEYRQTVPNDPLYASHQWALETIGAPLAWDESTGGLNVLGDTLVVAIIDNGFDIEHPDLQTNVWKNHSEIPNDGIDNDNNGYVDDFYGINIQDQSPIHPKMFHGTAVAGIIGASGNNNLGISGVNWNIKLMLVSNVQFIDEIIEAYYYVLRYRQKFNATNGNEGAYVIATNFSAGIDRQWGSEFPLWCNVYDSLGLAGVLNVSSVTNENYNVDIEGDLPSTCESPYLIVATNTTKFDQKAFSAGYGKKHVDLGAPGSGTYSLDLDGGYAGFDGTSGAAPHVSGSIALMHSIPCEPLALALKQNPSQTTLELRNAILDFVDPIPDLDTITSSGGRLSISNALDGINQYCTSETGTLQFFPGENPSRNLFESKFQSPDFEDYLLKVFSLEGKLIFRKILDVPRFSEKSIAIDIRNYAAGMYLVVIQRGDLNIVQKIIVH